MSSPVPSPARASMREPDRAPRLHFFIPLAALALCLIAASAAALIVAGGLNGVFTTSDTGVAWTPQSTGGGEAIQGIGNRGTGWMAVGSAGAALTSPLATAWTPQNTWSPTIQLESTDTDGSQWIAVGTSGTILRSTDGGISWNPMTSGTGNTLFGVATDGANWVAVGGSGGSATILRSTNGVSWVPQTAPASVTILYDVTHVGSKWVAAGANGRIISSLDGISWTIAYSNVAPIDFRGVAGLGSTWVAVGGYNGGAERARSTDGGVTWALTGGPVPLLDIAVCPGDPWTVVTYAGTIYTSSDATTWTTRASGTIEDLRAVECTPPQPPVLSCAPATQSVLVGDTISSLAAAGGDIPYSWTAPGSTTPGPVGGASFVTQYLAAGTYTATVTDAGEAPYYSPQSAACSVTVSNPPALTCSPESQFLAEGSTASFLAAGGTTPYSWSTPGSTSQGPNGGPSYTSTYDNVGSFTATLTDSSYYMQSVNCTVNVHVTCHEAPIADFVASAQAVAPGETVAFEDRSIGPVSTWLWDFGDSIQATTRDATHAFAGPGDYWVHLTVSSPYCPESVAAVEVQVGSDHTVQDHSSAGHYGLLADAGPDAEWPEGRFVVLAGRAIPAGHATFAWHQTGGPPVDLLNATTASPYFLAPRLGAQYAYGLTFTLQVAEGAAVSPFDTVNITVNPNHAPVAIAGVVRTAAVGEVVTLNGTASTDREGDPLSFAWEQVGDGPTVPVKMGQGGLASFTVPSGAEGLRLSFRLHVSDPWSSADDTAVILVVPAAAATPALAGDKASAPPSDAPPVPPGVAVPQWLVVSAAGLLAIALLGALVLAVRHRRTR